MVPMKDLIHLADMALDILSKMKGDAAPKAAQKSGAAVSVPERRQARKKSPAPRRRSNPADLPSRPGVFRRFLKSARTFLEGFMVFQALLRLLRRYLKFPAPAFIGRFLDSDFRRRMQPPALLVERSGVQKGMSILEIGCGSGAYTPAVARAAGDSGQVYALDIQEGMLRQIQLKLQRADHEDITNLQMVQGSASLLPFEKESLDLVYMVTVFQEIPNKAGTLKEIRRVLKRRGILAITELLPDPDYPWVTTTVSMGKAGGFRVEDVNGNIWNYTVRFRKP